MNRDASKKLATLLDSIEAVRTAEDADRRMKQQASEDFVSQFISVRDSVIRPAMEEVLAKLRERGHDGQIGPSCTSDSAKSESIELRIYLHKERPDHANEHACPSICFAAEAHSAKVRVHISRLRVRGGSGSAGPAGHLQLGGVTPEKVEELIVSVLDGL